MVSVMSVSDWARDHGADEDAIEGELEEPQAVLPPPQRAGAHAYRAETNVTPPEAQPPFLWWKNQQSVLYREAARRSKAARERAIGFTVWLALSFVLPDPWKYFAWWIAIGLGVAALWNAEHWVIAHRQARVRLDDD